MGSEGVSLSGWLHLLEESKSFLGKDRYRKCWFVLAQSETDEKWTLAYYLHNTRMREYTGVDRLGNGDRNIVDVDSIVSVSRIKEGNKFQLVLNDSRVKVLRAVSPSAAQRWMNAISGVQAISLPPPPKLEEVSETFTQDTIQKELEFKATRRERQSVKAVANLFLQDSDFFMNKASTYSNQVKGHTLDRKKHRGVQNNDFMQSTIERKAATLHGHETMTRDKKKVISGIATPKSKSGKGPSKNTRAPRLAVIPAFHQPLEEQERIDVKSETTSALLKQTIETSVSLSGVLFEDLDESALDELVEKMYRVDVQPKENVVNQFESGDHFYIIEKGRFNVYMQQQPDSLPELVAEKGPMTFFGELALLYQQPASVTIRAVTEGVLWTLNRDIFFKIRKANARKQRARKLRLLYGVDLFASNVSDDSLLALVDAMEMSRYESGETIVTVGESLDKMLIVDTGSLDVHVDKDGVDQITNLVSGDTYGEWFLMDKGNNASNAYLTTTAKTRILWLSVDEFEGVLGSLMDILKAQWEKQNHIPTETPTSLGSKLMSRMSLKSNDGKEGKFNLAMKAKIQTLKERFSTKGPNVSKLQTSSFEENTEDDTAGALDLEWAICPMKFEFSLDNLIPVNHLGKGNFGTVLLAKSEMKGPKYLALKCLQRQFIVKNGWEQLIENECRALSEITHYCDSPFIVKLFSAFYDRKHVYIAMELCDGGDLYRFLRKLPNGIMTEGDSKFYIASVILGIEAVHSRNILYRDLKPENLMLCSNGYIKLTDFGLAKKSRRTFTVCGTPEYMSPETILARGHDAAVDHWAVGILIHEIVSGCTPFHGYDAMEIYESILAHTPDTKLEYSISLSKPCMEMIQKLINPRKSQRMAAWKTVKESKFFKQFSWQQLKQQKLKPPIKVRQHKYDRYDTPSFYFDPGFQQTPTDRSDWVPSIGAKA